MRLRTLTAAIWMVMATSAVLAGERGGENVTVVPVFVDNRSDSVLFAQAKMVARETFLTAGVRIDWCGSCLNRPGVVVVSVVSSQQSKFAGRALALAMPFEGTHVEVALDRLTPAPPSMQPHLLAYVLVHEITHILKGTDAHSEKGVMKAVWNAADMIAISNKTLTFTADDIQEIRLGLKWRFPVASQNFATRVTQ